MPLLKNQKDNECFYRCNLYFLGHSDLGLKIQSCSNSYIVGSIIHLSIIHPLSIHPPIHPSIHPPIPHPFINHPSMHGHQLFPALGCCNSCHLNNADSSPPGSHLVGPRALSDPLDSLSTHTLRPHSLASCQGYGELKPSP